MKQWQLVLPHFLGRQGHNTSNVDAIFSYQYLHVKSLRPKSRKRGNCFNIPFKNIFTKKKKSARKIGWWGSHPALLSPWVTNITRAFAVLCFLLQPCSRHMLRAVVNALLQMSDLIYSVFWKENKESQFLNPLMTINSSYLKIAQTGE